MAEPPTTDPLIHQPPPTTNLQSRAPNCCSIHRRRRRRSTTVVTSPSRTQLLNSHRLPPPSPPPPPSSHQSPTACLSPSPATNQPPTVADPPNHSISTTTNQPHQPPINLYQSSTPTSLTSAARSAEIVERRPTDLTNLAHQSTSPSIHQSSITIMVDCRCQITPPNQLLNHQSINHPTTQSRQPPCRTDCPTTNGRQPLSSTQPRRPHRSLILPTHTHPTAPPITQINCRTNHQQPHPTTNPPITQSTTNQPPITPTVDRSRSNHRDPLAHQSLNC